MYNNNPLDEEALSEDKKAEIHFEALCRFDESQSAEQDMRDQAVEDQRFAWIPEAQWEDSAIQNRRDRPRYSINKIAQAINTVNGEQKQKRIEIKVRPTSDEFKENAQIMNGLIREIQAASNFNNIKDAAFKDSATGGIGGWYICTEWDGDSFDQNIIIKPIPSPATSIYYDTSAMDLLKRDANWMFVTKSMSRDAFIKKYPDSAISSLNSDVRTSSSVLHQDRDVVTVADYWIKEPYTKKLALLSDGRTIELNEKTRKIIDELALEGITIVRERDQESYKVKMYKMSDTEILEGPFEWAGKHIPVVPLFGFTTTINNQNYYWGLTRHSRDPQRIYNYATSAMIEAAALAPKDPFWLTPSMIEGHEAHYQNFNRKNTPFMFYNPDPATNGQPPQRTGAPQVQQALISQAQQADLDIQGTSGIYALSQGQNEQDQSGKAILALHEQGNKSSQELFSNLEKSVEYTGEILLDLIPKIYDSTRDVTLLNEDNTTENITLNNVVIDRQTGEQITLNDLSQGKYNIVADTQPTYKTQRTEMVNMLVKLSESSDAFRAVSPDLIAKNLDFEFGDELADRLRKIGLKQGTLEPNEEELREMQANQQGPSPQEMAQMELMKINIDQQNALLEKYRIENEELLAKIEHQRADTDKSEAQAAKTIAEIQTEMTQNHKLMSEINENRSEILKNGHNPDQPFDMSRFKDVGGMAVVEVEPTERPASRPPVDNIDNNLGGMDDDDMGGMPPGPVDPGLLP